MTRTDIFISGGGIAGLTAAAAFGAADFSVVITDPAPPITSEAARGADLRTTAFLQPARAFLERIGLWQRLASHAAPLQIMRIVDAGGPEAAPREVRDFNAADISELPFGWNLPNWLLRREILSHINTMTNVRFMPGVGFDAMLTRTHEARVKLSNGENLIAKLVVGADGRNSPVRNAAGISIKTKRYGQKAVTFAVTHEEPHHNISTEVHRSGGPFTLVPLPDYEGKPCSAVVWMEDGPTALRLSNLREEEFNALATARSAGVNGALRVASRRMVWPIISQIASSMKAERVALIAEAAHVVPPIGAQGLNMSLADLATLLDLTSTADDPGEPTLLNRYHSARYKDARLRVAGIDLLNRASQAEHPVLRDLRAAGLGQLHSIAPIRKSLMKIGLGAK